MDTRVHANFANLKISICKWNMTMMMQCSQALEIKISTLKEPWILVKELSKEDLQHW